MPYGSFTSYQSGTKWHADEATGKQIDFIVNLMKERNWRVADVVTVRVAKIVAQRDPKTGELPVTVTKKYASHAIDTLIKSPKNTLSTHDIVMGTNLKAAAQSAVSQLPASAKGCKFAVENTDPKSPNQWVFYELVQRKTGKFLNRLVGAPGDWKREFVNYKDYAGIVKRIEESSYVDYSSGGPEFYAGHKAAMMRFTVIFTCCSVCGSPLSAGKSISEAMGPVCSKKFK